MSDAAITMVAFRVGGQAILTAAGEADNGSDLLRDSIAAFAKDGGAAYVSDTIESLYGDDSAALTSEEIGQLGAALVENYKSNDNHGPDGRFTSGGGGGGSSGGGGNAARIALTVAVQAASGALAGSVAGGVGAAAGAAIGAAIAAFVESGAANFVGEKMIALFGPNILPAWAHAMLVDHHENYNKSVYMDSFLASLSDEDSKRLCTDVLARLNDDQLAALGKALVSDYQPQPDA
jgi:hypothetical protein